MSLLIYVNEIIKILFIILFILLFFPYLLLEFVQFYFIFLKNFYMNIIKKIENYINTNPDLKFFFRYLTYVVFLNIWIFFNINFLGDLLIVYFLKYNIVIDDYFNLYMIILLILVSLRLLYLFLSNIFVF